MIREAGEYARNGVPSCAVLSAFLRSAMSPFRVLCCCRPGWDRGKKEPEREYPRNPKDY